MTGTTIRRDETPAPTLKAVDDAGQLWRHVNPAELYRWVSRRNELLQTIAVAYHAPIARSR